MAQPNPIANQTDSGAEKSLLVLLGAEPERSPDLQAEVERIRKSDIFEVAQ